MLLLELFMCDNMKIRDTGNRKVEGHRPPTMWETGSRGNVNRSVGGSVRHQQKLGGNRPKIVRAMVRPVSVSFFQMEGKQ